MRKILFFFLLISPFVLKAQIKYDFENADLQAWCNAQDWTLADVAGHGKMLKHNLKSIAGVSYLALPLGDIRLNSADIEWRFCLMNGTFSPTSSNKFWFYLFSDKSNLVAACDGYAVGVNFTGSSGLLSLWKVKAGKSSLLIESGFTWSKNQNVAVRVSRTSLGEWSLGYSSTGSFGDLVSAGKKTDAELSLANYCGLYFKYSKTNAGALFFDDFQIGEANQPPRLLSYEFLDDMHVRLDFNEPIDSLSCLKTSNYSLGMDTLSIQVRSAHYDRIKPQSIVLQTDGCGYGDYTLSVAGIKDSLGMAMPTQSLNKTRTYEAKPNDLVVSEIMADPTPVVKLPEAEYIELFNRSAHELDLSGFSLAVNKSPFTFPSIKMVPGSYLVLTTKGSESAFPDSIPTLGILSGSVLTNAGASLVLSDAHQLVLDSVSYSSDWVLEPPKKDGGWSLEKIDAGRSCSPKSNWTVSLDPHGGTPGRINSLAADHLDQTSPKIVSADVLDARHLRLRWSEELAAPSVSASCFCCASLTLDSLVYDAKSLSVLLTFMEPLPEQAVGLSVKALMDGCGNKAKDTVLQVSYYEARVGEVVINEVMADPSPSVGLPVQRYIELYNASDKTLSSSSWSLVYGASQRKLPLFDLKPHAYLVLCPDSAVSALSVFGACVGWKDFPALASSSGVLALVDGRNTSLSWLSYSSLWHADDLKRSGGWSLERIDPSNLGAGADNWASSSSSLGGTPGQRNSVGRSNPDLLPPKLEKVIPLAEDSLLLYFSEPVVQIEGCLALDGTGVKSQKMSLVFPLNQCVRVKMNQKLEEGPVYQFKPSLPFRDDAGHDALVQDGLAFSLPSVAQKADVLFNELLFDAKTACPEFVELYNASKKAFNLNGLFISILDEHGKIKSPVRVSSDDCLLMPNDYIVLSDAPEKLPLFYPKAHSARFLKVSLPSLPNEGGHLVLVDRNDVWIDEFRYDPKMHSPLISDPTGVSLERVSSARPTNSRSNWSSASFQSGFATPGYRNSQACERATDSIEVLSLSSKVFSPDSEGNDRQLTITVRAEQTGCQADVYVYDAEGLLVKRLACREAIGADNVWVWEGTDESNVLQRPGVYIVALELNSPTFGSSRLKKACVLARKF